MKCYVITQLFGTCTRTHTYCRDISVHSEKGREIPKASIGIFATDKWDICYLESDLCNVDIFGDCDDRFYEPKCYNCTWGLIILNNFSSADG